MVRTAGFQSVNPGSIPGRVTVDKTIYLFCNTEGSPNGMALVSKTSGRNPLQVQVLYPPLSFGIEKNRHRLRQKKSWYNYYYDYENLQQGTQIRRPRTMPDLLARRSRKIKTQRLAIYFACISRYRSSSARTASPAAMLFW